MNNIATMAVVKPSNKKPLTLMDLPTELHLEIIDICLLHPAKVYPGPSILMERKLIGGSVRELTMVNHYFRDLTAHHLFKAICINDMSETTLQDLLLNSMKAMHRLSTSILLKNTDKLTVSLGRTPQAHHPYIEHEFISTLDFVRPQTQRFVMEKETAQWSFLHKVKKVLKQWQSNGMPCFILNTKQLELSAPWGHHFDFQFLTMPYIHMERLWLDFNPEWLRPDSLDLSRFKHLKYVMIRAFPRSQGENHNDKYSFNKTNRAKVGHLARTLPHLKHFAMYGLIRGPVTKLAYFLAPMKSLEQLDITDEQPVSFDRIIAVQEMQHPVEAIDKAMCQSKLVRESKLNTDRIEAATVFFTAMPSLKRICFVRDQVGTMYHAIRGEDGVLERVEEGETITEKRRYLLMDNVKQWRCGFPNVLGYNLFEADDVAYYRTLKSEKAFWMNQAFLDGDVSVVPPELEWKRCLWQEYGQTE
ncbi:hypothetical protein VP1G_06637 [Cytospora mali]|uniref:Uncharacterized protein n=1 Tax=Cytospora mali TaxID=578113 RepID=A0A194V627_CYTMA|nr:hypothetical protein VP1G_06637 [Valsa mali var. pyri (nom. inval.)]